MPFNRRSKFDLGNKIMDLLCSSKNRRSATVCTLPSAYTVTVGIGNGKLLITLDRVGSRVEKLIMSRGAYAPRKAIQLSCISGSCITGPSHVRVIYNVTMRPRTRSVSETMTRYWTQNLTSRACLNFIGRKIKGKRSNGLDLGHLPVER